MLFPTCWAMAASSNAVSGESSEGFSITVHPEAKSMNVSVDGKPWNRSRRHYQLQELLLPFEQPSIKDNSTE